MNTCCANMSTLKQPYVNRPVTKLGALRVITKVTHNRKMHLLLSLRIFAVSLYSNHSNTNHCTGCRRRLKNSFFVIKVNINIAYCQTWLFHNENKTIVDTD